AEHVAAPRPPGNLAPELAFGVAGDPDPVLTGLLAEPFDPGGAGRLPRLLRGGAGKLDVRQRADDEDLLTIGPHLGPARKPAFGDALGEPGADVLGHDYKITALGGRLRRLVPDDLDLAHHDLRPVLLLARSCVVPRAGVQLAVDVYRPALFQPLSRELRHLAEGDQRVELGPLLRLALVVLAGVRVRRQAHPGHVHAAWQRLDVRVGRQVAD